MLHHQISKQRWQILSSLFFLGLISPSLTHGQIRFATFNVSLSRNTEGELADQLAAGNHEQITKIAAIIRTVRPDVILLNEFDYAGEQANTAVEHFQSNYLSKPVNNLEPMEYGYAYSNEVNTGIPSGMDLDGNGKTTDPTDCFGFGRHPGQYGMLVLSRFPLGKVRTFQKFLWKDMPRALLPTEPDTDKPYYSDSILEVFRLSSKSHWDIPVKTPQGEIHFLVCHPTPPVFDGPEDKNGTRNHDEIRFWAEYISPQTNSYITDDNGQRGGLNEDARFIIAGDLNADPIDGDSTHQAINQLLDNPLVRDPRPQSKGGLEASRLQAQINTTHRGKPGFDTGDFSDRSPGNLRIDYVLPDRKLKILGTGIFWPESNMASAKWISASDHRLVWLDIKVK